MTWDNLNLTKIMHFSDYHRIYKIFPDVFYVDNHKIIVKLRHMGRTMCKIKIMNPGYYMIDEIPQRIEWI